MPNSAGSRYYPYDWLVIGYCFLMLVLIAVFGRPLATYYNELIFYAVMAGIAMSIACTVDEKKGRLHAFIRLIYPALMFMFFYRATGGVMFLFFDGFFDWQLTTFERLIFSVNPTLYIDRHLLSIWANEVLSFCYFNYYLMLPVFLLPVFWKKDYRVLRQSLSAICLTFFLSYLLFALYPIEGPRWYFASDFVNPVESPVFRPMVELVITHGAVRGGCMPSSHVGVALVIMMFCFKHYRPFGWVLLPINIGLAIGTVWGRYHYVSDVFVGGAIGIFSTLLIWKYYDHWTRQTPKAEVTVELTAEHVS